MLCMLKDFCTITGTGTVLTSNVLRICIDSYVPLSNGFELWAQSGHAVRETFIEQDLLPRSTFTCIRACSTPCVALRAALQCCGA